MLFCPLAFILAFLPLLASLAILASLAFIAYLTSFASLACEAYRASLVLFFVGLGVMFKSCFCGFQNYRPSTLLHHLH